MWEAARTFLDLTDAVLQTGYDVRTRQFEGGERVLERQHRQNLAHGDLTLIDRSAQAAAVLNGDPRPLVTHAIEHGVSNEVAHLAFAGSASLALTVDGCVGFTDDLRL